MRAPLDRGVIAFGDRCVTDRGDGSLSLEVCGGSATVSIDAATASLGTPDVSGAWGTGSGYSAAGAYILGTTTNVEGTIVRGEWIQFAVASTSALSAYAILPASSNEFGFPRRHMLVGANVVTSSTRWQRVSGTPLTRRDPGAPRAAAFTLPGAIAYATYRLIVLETQTNCPGGLAIGGVVLTADTQTFTRVRRAPSAYYVGRPLLYGPSANVNYTYVDYSQVAALDTSRLYESIIAFQNAAAAPGPGRAKRLTASVTACVNESGDCWMRFGNVSTSSVMSFAFQVRGAALPFETPSLSACTVVECRLHPCVPQAMSDFVIQNATIIGPPGTALSVYDVANGTEAVSAYVPGAVSSQVC